MKFLLLLAALVGFSVSADAPIKSDGTCRGVRLCGRVRVVSDGRADFRVRIVSDGHADLRVRWMDSPRRVGEWHRVESSPDFTVRFVEQGADFAIRVVEDHPGLP
jgi:hypothetical protein